MFHFPSVLRGLALNLPFDNQHKTTLPPAYPHSQSSPAFQLPALPFIAITQPI